MCEYCEKGKLVKSCNFCGSAKITRITTSAMVIIESSMDQSTLRFCLLAAIGVSQFSFGFAVSINISIKIKSRETEPERRTVIKQIEKRSVNLSGTCRMK